MPRWPAKKTATPKVKKNAPSVLLDATDGATLKISAERADERKLDQLVRAKLIEDQKVIDRVFLAVLADRIESRLPVATNGQSVELVVDRLQRIAGKLTA